MAHDHVERWSGFKVLLYSLFSNDSERNQIVVDTLNLSPDDHFLDIGCGLGGALELASWSGASVAGIDPSASMVSRAAKRVPAATVKVGSAEEIPFPDATFTAVTAVASFHHWASQMTGIAEVARVMTPGGRLLIAEKRLKDGRGHGLSISEAERLVRNLSSRGFENGEVAERDMGRHPALTVSATRSAHPSVDPLG